MTERQLRMAITEPAKKAGCGVEDDLVEALLRDMRTRQVAPPARGCCRCCRTPSTRPGAAGPGMSSPWPTMSGRAASKGPSPTAHNAPTTGSLLPSKPPPGRSSPGSPPPAPDGVDTADRASRAELTEGKSPAEARDVEAVLEAFAAERLLILAAGTVEISHEVLLTAWPLLRDTWLAETHADRIVRTRLHNVAAEWARDAHDPSYLYGGSLLQTATETAERISADPARHPPLSQTERDFLHASDHARRQSVRRRRASSHSSWCWSSAWLRSPCWPCAAGRQTARQRDLAASGQLINRSETLGDTDPTVSKLLSIAAWRTHPSNDARHAMLAAAARPGIATLAGHTDRVHSVAFSPDGRILASGSFDGTVRLWDVDRHKQIGKPLNGHAGEVYSVAFSRDGRTLASGNGDGRVVLWDVATRQQIEVLSAGNIGEVYSVAFSPDGKTIAGGAAWHGAVVECGHPSDRVPFRWR